MHAPLINQTVPMRGDARELLRSLPDGVATVSFFDPQHRTTLDRLQYGNEGARQKERYALPSMTDSYIEQCCRDLSRVLRPAGYCFLWVDQYRLGRGEHLHVADVLLCVAVIAWDSERMGMGYRVRERGDYLLVLQKPPLKAKTTWRDHSIASRWAEKVDRKIHPHVKPIGLLKRLILATTELNDLIIDPAAGSFIVMSVAHALGRRFAGCDICAATGLPEVLS